MVRCHKESGRNEQLFQLTRGRASCTEITQIQKQSGSRTDGQLSELAECARWRRPDLKAQAPPGEVSSSLRDDRNAISALKS